MKKKPNDGEEIIQLTLRLARPEWERVSILAIEQRDSIQGLVVRGLNLLFEELGQRPLRKK